MGQRIYKLGLETIAQKGRKSKKVKKIKNLMEKKHGRIWNAEWMFYVNLFYSEHYNNIKNTMEPIVHSDEYQYLTSEKLSYFFDDAETAQGLLDASYNIKDSSALSLHSESFMLSLPTDCNVNPNGSGLLVVIRRADEEEHEAMRFFEEVIRCADVTYQPLGEKGIYAVAINYRIGKDFISRAMLPSNWLPEVLKCKTWLDYKTFMDENNHFTYEQIGTDGLSKEDYMRQFEIIKLVCAFLVYRNACPERIKDGLPSEHRAISTQLTKTAKSQCINGIKRSRSEQGTHYRSWHFRQLTHERYYKGEHKNKAIGSRIIFVRDSIVNDEAEVKTIT